MDVIYATVAIAPLIIGLVAMLKGLGLRAEWAPAAAVGLGLAISLLYALASGAGDPRALADAVLLGLALGLSAVGLYSGVKHTRKPTMSDEA